MSTRRKLLPVVALSIPIVLVILSALAGIGTSQSQTPPNVDEHKRLVEAIRRGGYREAAKVKGRYIGVKDPSWDLNFDLETLTKTSAAVVIGVPQRGISQLSSDGSEITTNYNVRVDSVIKGSLALNSIFEVSLPGGRVDFEDGTSAEIQTPGFERMRNGKKYLLFLYANRNGSDVFLLTGGSQGLYELTTSGKVLAQGRPTDQTVKETQNKNLEGLLEEIRIYVEKWPQAKGCCN